MHHVDEGAAHLGSGSEMTESFVLCRVDSCTTWLLSELLEARLIDVTLALMQTCSEDCATLLCTRQLISVRYEVITEVVHTVGQFSEAMKIRW
jgi:hypothetical protein